MAALGTKLRTIEGGRLGFWCPGCETAHHVWIKGMGVDPNGWTFDGNAEKPTFGPSVLVTGDWWEPPVTPANIDEWNRAPWEQTKVHRICHSFVEAGMIRFLNDSTHKLKGQTAPLPDFP